MDEALLAFLDTLAAAGEAHDARETEHARRMLNITPDTGRLLWMLARAIAATRILEVGTSNAFSTIWLADAVREAGGRVTTLERSPAKIAQARANLAAARLDGFVDIVEGLAVETLLVLPGPFDLIFLDADRANYLAYLELALPKLRPGGILVADNVISHAHELTDYVARVSGHPQLFAVTLPVGNGEQIALKLGRAHAPV